MTVKACGSGRAPLVESAERRIRVLQKQLKSDGRQAERKVRQLERAQLFYAVVCRLGSDDADEAATSRKRQGKLSGASNDLTPFSNDSGVFACRRERRTAVTGLPGTVFPEHAMRRCGSY